MNFDILGSFIKAKNPMIICKVDLLFINKYVELWNTTYICQYLFKPYLLFLF